MESEFTSSRLGDILSFFKHTDIERDFRYKPEWEDATEDIISY